jgi:hypothetical protein
MKETQTQIPNGAAMLPAIPVATQIQLVIQELLDRACELASRYLKTEVELIEILQKLDQHRVYLKFSCGSLFEYATSVLKLSESTAYNFITVSRKATQVPELKAAILSGELSISKARRITSVITRANQNKWILTAKQLTQKSLEREIAKVLTQALTPEKAKYVQENRVKLELGVSAELFRQIKRVQELESQRMGSVATIEAAINAMTAFYLEKKDPVLRAMRSVAKPDLRRVGRVIAADTATAVESAVKVSFGRVRIASRLKSQIYLRDKGKCTHRHSSGEQCQNSRWVHIHHIVPVSRGGANTLSNLQTLFSSHHRMLHEH